MTVLKHTVINTKLYEWYTHATLLIILRYYVNDVPVALRKYTRAM